MEKKLSNINELADEQRNYGSALSMERYSPPVPEEQADFDYFAEAGYNEADMRALEDDELKEDDNTPEVENKDDYFF